MKMAHSYTKPDLNQELKVAAERMLFARRRVVHILALLGIAFIAASSPIANAGPCDPSTGVRKVYAHDFHAVGDGKTDDGPALRAALNAVTEGTKPASLELDPGKTYRIASFEDTYALRILNTQKVTVHGNGAELLLLPPNKVLRLVDSSDINVCGLTVDYSPLPFTQGTIVATDAASGTFDLEIDEGFDVSEADGNKSRDDSHMWEFAMPYKQGRTFEKRVNVRSVHTVPGKRRMRITPTENSPSRPNNLTPNDTHLVITMPGRGQMGNFAFQILNNKRVHVEGIHIYAVPQYTFYIANNQDTVKFVNVEQRPRPGTSRVMSGWRDVFHVKDNRAPIQWDGCYIEGAFDDAFNLSAMYQVVTKKLGPKSWRLRDLGKDGAPLYKPGDRLQAIDLIPDRKLIGESTIVSVTQNGSESDVTLSTPLPLKAMQDSCNGDDEACGSRIINLDAANEGSVIRNSTIFGSVRLRSKVTLEHCKLDGFLQIASTPAKEGPSPTGVIIQDCELSGTVKIGADVNTKRGWDDGERWAQGIQFRNNRIMAVFRAEGASFSLIDNDVIWPNPRKFDLKNCGPVYIHNLTANGTVISNPMSKISIGQNMATRDVIIK